MGQSPIDVFHSDKTEYDQKAAGYLEEEKKRLKLKEKADVLQQRKSFSGRIFALVLFYVLAVLAIIVLCGFDVLSISDAVLIALLSTTTANVVGLLVIVMKYFFPALAKV